MSHLDLVEGGLLFLPLGPRLHPDDLSSWTEWLFATTFLSNYASPDPDPDPSFFVVAPTKWECERTSERHCRCDLSPPFFFCSHYVVPLPALHLFRLRENSTQTRTWAVAWTCTQPIPRLLFHHSSCCFHLLPRSMAWVPTSPSDWVFSLIRFPHTDPPYIIRSAGFEIFYRALFPFLTA